MITYRDYQNECHDAILEKWRSHRSTLASLATGLGKTAILAKVIHTQQPRRALVLAHRKELILQARSRIEEATGLPCEIEMAELSARRSLFHECPVVIGSIQTMLSGTNFKRMGKFKPEEFGVVVIDEAHHSTSKSYRQIIDYFSQNPDLKILGVTATPDRADKEALGQIFESVAFDYGILDGVENGWLVDVTQLFYKVESLDFSHVKTTAGDLNGADLAALMEMEENIQGVCQPTLEVMFALKPKSLDAVAVGRWSDYLLSLRRTPRRTIVFTASVIQAEACCSIFNRVIPGLFEWVCGKTKDTLRADTLRNFVSGKTAGVANCGVLTEGYDNPFVEVIIMARPTESRALYTQMVGRSTRPLPGLVDGLETAGERLLKIGLSPKPICRIVDFVGNSGKHRLMTSMDILGGKVSDDVVKRSILDALEKGRPVRVCRTLSNEEIKAQKEREELDRKRRLQEEAAKKKLVAKVAFSHHEVNPFDSRFQGAYLNPTHRWLKKPLTKKQRDFLRKHGYNPDKMKPEQGKVLIRVIYERNGYGKKKGKHETNHHHGSAGSLTGEYLPDESTNPF